MARRTWRGAALALAAAALLLAGCSSSASGPGSGSNSASGSGSGSSTGGATRAAVGPGGQHVLAPIGHAGVATPSAAGGGSSAAQTASQIVPAQAALVVRTGTITLGVPARQISSVFDRISTIAQGLGGFVESSAQGSGGGAQPLPEPRAVASGGASLVLRVPRAQFGELAGQVASLGRVRFQQLSGRDVTGESVDLVARIKNLDAEEVALRAILSRAGSITDVLQVQNELFNVEGEAEQLAGQESSLLDHATFATLTVSILPGTSAPPKQHHKPPENVVLRAIHLAGHNMVLVFRGVVITVGWAFPLLILAAAGALGWLVRRRWRRRSTPPAPAA